MKQVPEDARARILLGSNYAEIGRVDDAMRETNLAITLRANEASILYNAACTYCFLKKKQEALDTIAKPGKPDLKTPAGPAKTPIWLCYTATLFSSVSIPPPSSTLAYVFAGAALAATSRLPNDAP